MNRIDKPPPPNKAKNVFDRELPYDLDAERAVLGSCLLDDGTAIDAARPILGESGAVFWNEAHTRLWAAILSIRDAGLPIDGIVLKDELLKRDNFEQLGGYELLSGLISSVPSSLRVREYARIVREHYDRRNLVSSMSRAREAAYDLKTPLSIAVAEAIHDLDEIGAGPANERGVSLTEALGNVAEAAENERPIVETLKTGIALLDDAGGLVRGEYLAIAGAPGVGKSLLADRTAIGVLRNSPAASALVLNLETSTRVRVSRLICGEAVEAGPEGQITRYIPLGPLLRGELREAGHVREVADRLAAEIGGRLRFVDNVRDVAGIVELIRTAKPDLVVIDHCGLIDGDGIRGSSQTEIMDVALRMIDAALKDAGAAGVLIAELNKQALTTGSADAGAIRGTARLASLAGSYVGIVRDTENAGEDPLLCFQLFKCRHGRAGVQQGAFLMGGMGYLHFAGVVELIPEGAKG